MLLQQFFTQANALGRHFHQFILLDKLQRLLQGVHACGDEAREHERKVHEWRDAILTIARAEMGHLLTVQNCICLLGGPLSFEREDYPWDTPYYPFEFCLEPLTRRSLAKYVFAEMPAVFSEDEKKYYEVAKAAKRELGLHVGHPVGEVYDAIIEIVSDPKKILDSDFDANTYGCLLYTSDAADERSSVDLGGRRIIKKKKRKKTGVKVMLTQQNNT